MTAEQDTMTRAELGRALRDTIAEVDELKRARKADAVAERRIRKLNAILRAVRNVNQLITREKDPTLLLRGACRHLAETRDCLAAWAVAWQPGRLPSVAAQAGLHISDETLLELYRKGLPARCLLEPKLHDSELRVIRDFDGCEQCAIGKDLPPRAVHVAPLKHKSELLGTLAVATPLDHTLDEDERLLLIEVAGDLGFALHAIELEGTTREAMALLYDSERRYRELFEAMSSGVAVYRAVDGGQDFELVDFNRAGEHIEQVRREDIVGRRVTEVFPGVRDFGLLDVLRRVYETGHPERVPITEYRDERIQGWRENYIYRLPSKEVVVVYDDVTEARQAEQQLHDTMTLYKTLVSTSPDATIMTDLSGFLTFVSPQAAQLFGYDSANAMIGNAAARLVHPNDRATGLEAFARVIDEGILRDFSLLCLRRDGTSFHGELSASTVRRDDGTPRSVIAVVRDVTMRHEAEEAIRTINLELEKRVRLRTAELTATNKELEAFAYSVSHDLRSPLRSINFFCNVALEDYGEQLPGEVVQYFRRIAASTTEMAHLIRSLLEFSRAARAELEKEVVDLSELAQEVVQRLRQEQPTRNVVVEIDPGLVALGDKDLLRQALQNLFGNAWKFTSQVAKPRIHFGCTEVDGDQTFFIRDNGAGFDMAHASRLFEPFQRLHDSQDFPGTGIGLATVKRIMGRHGGRVWAQSEGGKGATFYFTLDCESVQQS